MRERERAIVTIIRVCMDVCVFVFVFVFVSCVVWYMCVCEKEGLYAFV